MTVHIAPVGLSIIVNLAKIEKLKFVEEPAGPNPIEQDFPWTELIKQVQASGYLESIYPGKKPKDVMEAMFETGSAADSPERDELQEIADRINVGEWIRYRGVSAELDTLRQAAIEISSAKKKEEFLPSRKDTVFLLATDTDKGIAAAWWNAIALANGDIRRIRYLSDLDENARLDKTAIGCIHILRIPGLDAFSSDQAFREPMKIMGRLGRLLVAPPESMLEKVKRIIQPREEIRFYLSGGYKATIPYLVALAEWVRSLGEDVSAWIMHETSRKPFQLPLRRLEVRQVRHELKPFYKDGKTKNLETNFFEGYAYEIRGKEYRLTAFGQGMCELFGIPTESVPQ